MEGNKSKGTIVFFSLDAVGHINPILSIVSELQRRCYRAVILTISPLSIAPKLKAEGFELDYCEKAQDDSNCHRIESAEKFKNIMEPLMDLFRQGPEKAAVATYRLDGACGKYLQDVVEKHDLIEAKLKSLNPDLVVVDNVVGVPCVLTIPKIWVRIYSGFPSILYSDYNENLVSTLGLKLEQMTPERREFTINIKATIRERLRQFFKEKNAPDWESEIDIAPTSPYLNFYLGPEELAYDKLPQFKPLPERWFRLEHTLQESNSHCELDAPKEFMILPGKLVYFSLGTLVSSDVKLINRLLEILSKSPNKFIVSKGQLHEQINLFPNMWGDGFLNQKAVLSRADLFITHGGHNSIIEAFYFGVPGLIVLPVFADQFDGAQRIQDCELGIRLNPFECSEEELLEAVNFQLNNHELAKRMKSISERLKSIKYHEIAADKLENLIRSY